MDCVCKLGEDAEFWAAEDLGFWVTLEVLAFNEGSSGFPDFLGIQKTFEHRRTLATKAIDLIRWVGRIYNSGRSWPSFRRPRRSGGHFFVGNQKLAQMLTAPPAGGIGFPENPF